MKKTYRIEYEYGGSIQVEIDHDIMTEDQLHEINNFWSDYEWRLSESEDNVLHAVLRMLLIECLQLGIEHGYNIKGIISAFDWDGQGFGPNGIEGWPKMDGSDGIKIVDFDGFTFEPCDIEISEVA